MNYLDSAQPGRIGDCLSAHAAANGTRKAMEYDGEAYSYAEVDDWVDICARAYLALGLKRGDCMAMLSSPRPEAFISFLAAARLGILWLGLNPKHQPRELSYVISDAKPRLILTVESLDGRQYAPELQSICDSVTAVSHLVSFSTRPTASDSFFGWANTCGARLQDGHALQIAVAETEEMDPALLVYTSGSSGNPKGVLLRQRELLQRSRNQLARFPTADPPVLLNPLPINHIGGMHFLGLFAFVGGGCIRFSQKFSASEYLEALRQESINIVIVLPTMVKLMVDEPDFSPTLLKSIDWFVFSGAAMSTELLDLIKTSGCRIGLTYGMTETCGSVPYSDPDASIEALVNTIGRPFPEGEVRVADDLGVLCEVGIAGELQVLPTYCMGGYLNRPEATREVYTTDGWLRTGDTAILREDGNIRFVGRRSEMFKSGGYNVYPREVEVIIESHDSIRLSAVVGVPDPLFDEVGWAYVIPADANQFSEQILRDWCKNELASYKIPKRFIVCTELPLLPVGKVDKVALRKQAQSDAHAGCANSTAAA